MQEYPGNSQNKRPDPTPAPEPKKLEPVITGKVIRKKPSIGKKFKEIFIGDDAQSVWLYLAYDILVPAVKDTVSDMVSMGVERMLFGEGRAPGRRYGGSSDGPRFTNYNKVSSGRDRYDRGGERRQLSRRARAAHNFDEIILETRVEANEVLNRLFDVIERYDAVKVSDLYDLVGATGDFTDEKYGWTDLRGAKVVKTGVGYLLDLPTPELLEN